MLPLNRLFAVVFLCIHLAPFAQTSKPFQPLAANAAQETALRAAIATRYNQDISGLSGPNKKYIAAIYNERYSLTEEKFKDGELLCNDATQRYLDDLAAVVFKSNPTLKATDVRLVFSRSFYANASSLGEGTILFNIGLFHRLQNEAQAAFVICHELAHYYLNHGNDNIENYVETVYGAAFQKKVKQIQKSDYRQNSQLEALAKNLMFRSRRHSRTFEQAADSMAVELLKNTAFDVRETLTCLQLLDSADTDKYNNDPALEKRFHFAAFPFKQRWLQQDALLFGTAAKEETTAEQDSLKTHPDCKKRIAVLAARVQQYAKPAARRFVVSEQLFQNLIAQFDFEIIEYCVQSKQTSRALYYTLQMLPQFPDDAYLHATVGRCLNVLYAAQKAHELGKVTDLPNAAFSEKYNTLLQFIQNLRLPEIGALAYYYLNENAARFAGDSRFAEALATSNKNHNRP